MPVAEAALAYVGSKVLDYVAGEAINAAGTASASGLRTKLGRDPARLACQLALARAEARFASAYPQWHSAFFDQSFLATRAAPLLARALTRSDTATAAELAEAWCLELGGRTGERYREQIEPAAAEFLGWWRGELGRFEVFRPVLDSRALDSTAASTHATADEVRVLRAQLTDALGQLDRAVVRARYPALSDFLDWPSRDMVRRTRGIVGREWVFEELSHFAQRRCGYVHLIADAGLGKTELAVAIARRHDAPAFFFTASDRRTRPERCLDHLSVELIDRHGLAHDRLPEHSGEDSGFLSQLLSEIDSTQRPVWLVIDALDEADAHGAGNLVGLPAELPPKVFVVLSHRPGDYTLNVRPGIAQDELHLRADDPRHARDVTQYLHQRANEQAVAEGLARARPPVQPGEFARVLAVASEGNFMYLDYLLADLVDETTPTLDATRLPRGLTGYYREMWQTIRQDAERDSEQWDWLHLPLLEHLAVAGEPVSPAWLGNHLAAPEKSVRRVLRHWQRFLHQTPHERWRIIHQSFRDYLAETDEVELGAAHRAIAEYYLADDERRSVHEGYALRHLSRHLRHAGESDRLFLLVEDAGWQELQDLHDPSWSNYLTDVGQAWATAAELDAHALARRQRPRWLLQETLQAIATAELHSASALIPTKLLHRLLEAGAWTAQHGLLVASRNPDAASRVEALAVVVSHLPAEQRNRTLTGALADAASVADPDVQAHVLGSLGPHLSASLFADAFAQAASIPKPAARATALARLAPYLPERRGCQFFRVS